MKNGQQFVMIDLAKNTTKQNRRGRIKIRISLDRSEVNDAFTNIVKEIILDKATVEEVFEDLYKHYTPRSR